jgi:hypothetical protein
MQVGDAFSLILKRRTQVNVFNLEQHVAACRSMSQPRVLQCMQCMLSVLDYRAGIFVS